MGLETTTVPDPDSTVSLGSPPAPPPASPATALAIPGFTLGPLLGRGGMGQVYRATQQSLGREVALKVMDTTQGIEQERFLREMRLLARLNHPHVVTCFDAGRTAGNLFIAMELVAGGDAAAAARAAGGCLPPERAVAIVRDAALGVQALHEAGLIHRDLKPHNLLLAEEGRAKVADLGLVRVEDASEELTGGIVGTPAFMAPEQASHAPDLDRRCDVYALGATLFALLTGEPPFRGTTPLHTALLVARGPTPCPSQRRPDLPADLCAIIRTAMAHRREERPETARELARTLDAWLRHRESAGDAGFPVPIWARTAGQDRLGPWAAIALEDQLLRLRLIPPQTFTMGSPPGAPGRLPDEHLHPVTLTGRFWISETSLLINGGLAWDEARRWASAHGGRLPTEAEWEGACRQAEGRWGQWFTGREWCADPRGRYPQQALHDPRGPTGEDPGRWRVCRGDSGDPRPSRRDARDPAHAPGMRLRLVIDAAG